MLVTVKCQSCSGAIELDALEYRDVQTVTCPHCAQSTNIQAPRVQKTLAPKTVEGKPPEVPKGQSLEKHLDGVGDGYFTFGLIIGLLGVLAGGIALLSALSENASPAPGVGLIFASVCFICQSWIAKLLFKTLAEALRLLRRIADRRP